MNNIKGRTPAEQAAIDEYFANGGKVTVCPKNERTEGLVVNMFKRGRGRPKKKDVDKGLTSSEQMLLLIYKLS